MKLGVDAEDEGETKSKSLYMMWCALILHYFALEYILAYGIDLMCCKPKDAKVRCDALVQDLEICTKGILLGLPSRWLLI